MSEIFYTCLLNKIWIGIELKNKHRGFKIIKMLGFKKALLFTGQQLSHFLLRYVLDVFLEESISTIDVTQGSSCEFL